MPISRPPVFEESALDRNRLLLTLLIPAFVTLLAVSSVNVILPAVSQDLRSGTAGLQLVVSGYALVFGVVLVPAGRAGDVMGRGRIFVIGMVLFGIGSLASGLAPDVVTLNLARVVMGIGSGLLNPQVAGMIQQFYTGEARGWAFGLFGAVIGVSVAVGPVISGGLIGWFGGDWGWRASFLINVPLVLLGLLAAHLYLPTSAWRRQDGRSHRDNADRADSAGSSHRSRVDLDPLGMVLLAASTLLVMIPFMEASAGVWVWGLEIVGVGLMGAWVAWEKRYLARGGVPMVDLSLLAIPSFAYGSLAIAVYFLGYTSVWIIVAQYIQAGLGSTALVSGLIGVPAALAGSVAAALAGDRVIRVGRIMVLGGMALGMVGLLASVGIIHMHARAGWSPWWLTLTLLLLGVGQGLVVSPNQTLSLADVPLEYAGAAGGILQTGERIGASIGIAAITGLTFRVSHSSGWDAAAQAGLLAVVGAVAVSAGVAVVELRLAARRRG